MRKRTSTNNNLPVPKTGRRNKRTKTNPNGQPFRVLRCSMNPVTPQTAEALSTVWRIALAQPETCNEPSSIVA
jgi:hypothetical protein